MWSLGARLLSFYVAAVLFFLLFFFGGGGGIFRVEGENGARLQLLQST